MIKVRSIETLLLQDGALALDLAAAHGFLGILAGDYLLNHSNRALNIHYATVLLLLLLRFFPGCGS